MIISQSDLSLFWIFEKKKTNLYVKSVKGSTRRLMNLRFTVLNVRHSDGRLYDYDGLNVHSSSLSRNVPTQESVTIS